jgi:hypothetical protein
VITRNAFSFADFGTGFHYWNPSLMAVNFQAKRRGVSLEELGRYMGCDPVTFCVSGRAKIIYCCRVSTH